MGQRQGARVNFYMVKFPEHNKIVLFFL